MLGGGLHPEEEEDGRRAGQRRKSRGVQLRHRSDVTTSRGHLEPPAAGRFKAGSFPISFRGNMALPIP